MPWKETTPMSQRTAFLEQALQDGANLSALCRSYGISRKTAYKWLQRAREEGPAGLEAHSRRPHASPHQTSPELEGQVLTVRTAHPAWGARKIRRVLQTQGQAHVPAASTITAILRRHGQLDPAEAVKHRPFRRFERDQPNQLWQMDFKGYFALGSGGYCHPLTVIDDHSRFLVGLKACPDQTFGTVQRQLTAIFEQVGLPEWLLMDNGPPWGDDRQTPHTVLTAWLIRLGIATTHGRPRHPQTQGKNERFNRTLLAEVISRQALNDLGESQAAFDAWGQVYNYQRPHEALQLATPATRYQPSPRPFPAVLPPVSYPSGDVLRKVDAAGKISFQGRKVHVGKAFSHQPVGVRSTPLDGQFEVYFCHQRITRIDLRQEHC
jgi:transposase InsO family protein